MRIPVTHTVEGNQLPVGIWFYYARGCSDLSWNAGRSLLARNRCHAAVLLDQLVYNSSWVQATERVSKGLYNLLRNHLVLDYSIVRKHVLNSEYVHSHTAISGQLNRTHAEHLALRFALDECAQGVFGVHDRHCLTDAPPTSGDDLRCAGSCLHRAMALSRLAGLSSFDFYSWANLLKLSRTHQAIDTVQLEQQPQGQGSTHWTTEIWDITRDLARANRMLPDPRPFGQLDGSDCMLSDTSRYCLACNDSRLSHSCNFRCSRTNGNVSFAAPHGIDGWHRNVRRSAHLRWEHLFFRRGVNNVAHEIVVDAALWMLHEGDNISDPEVQRKVLERFKGGA